MRSYHEIYKGEDNRSASLGQRVQTLKKVPLSVLFQISTATKKRDTAIEHPLFKEESLDSVYRRSAEKNLFEMPRESHLTDSKQSSVQFKIPPTPEYLAGAEIEYDPSALFWAAEQIAGNLKSSFQDLDDEAREISKINETTLLLEKLVPSLEQKFITRKIIRGDHSFSTTRIDPDARNVSFLNQDQTGVAGFSDMLNTFQERGKNRKLNFDESTILPDSGFHSNFSNSHTAASSINWNNFDMDVNAEDVLKDEKDKGVLNHLDQDLTFLMNSVPSSAQKTSKCN